jgi:hypothetical protein
LNVCKEAKENLNNDRSKGPALLVNVRQEPGGITRHCQCLDSARRSVCTRVCDTQGGDEDNGINNRRQNFNASVLDGQHKGTSRRINTSGGCGTGTKKARVGIWNVKTDNEQIDDVEQGDTPQHLFGGFGKRFAWVPGLRSRKANQFCATVGKYLHENE